MKTVFKTLFIFAITLTSLQAQNQRLAYSYTYAKFDKAIPDQMDKDKLTSKEEKLYKKFMKSLDRKTMVNSISILSKELEALNYEVLPLTSVSVISSSSLNMDGYPNIIFPKKTLKKHIDKDIADVFISATVNVTKPLVALAGMKPTITVSLKQFSKSGELLKKVTATHKTEKKIGNIGFAVSNSESFSKIDQEHAEILFTKVEPTLILAIQDAVRQLGEEE